MTKKLIFHKGLTTKDPKRDVYTKSYVGLEYDVADEADEGTIAQILIRMRSLVEQELGVNAEPSADVSQIPQFDTAELSKLPWKTKNKEDAQEGQWGWILGPESTHGTQDGAETLATALLHTKDNKFVLGDMEYSLSKNKAFINRKPVKQESAK